MTKYGASLVCVWTMCSPPWSANACAQAAGVAPVARRALLAQGRLVRDCTSFGLPQHARVSLRRPDQNDRLLEALASLAPPGERS